MDEQKATKEDSCNEVDVAIVSILTSNPAISDRELGEQLGLSRQTVNRRRNSQVVKELLKSRIEDSFTQDDIKRLIAKSMRAVEQCLDSHDERIRLAAAIPMVRLMSDSLKNAAMYEQKDCNIIYETTFGGKTLDELSKSLSVSRE